MEVSIIIVNYNTKQLTENCLDSIFEYTKDIEFEVILIDNASVDGSREYFEKDKRIIFIKSEENLGFGKANNLATQYASGKYYFFLNSDTLLKNNVIKFFLDFIEKSQNRRIGALGCLLKDEMGNVIHSFGNFTSPFSIIRDNLKFYWRKEEKITLCKIPMEVDYICGADLFIPHTVFRQMGGFDPLFFMYYEENDLQRRMALVGYTRWLIKGPLLVHLEGASYHFSGVKKTNSKRINSDESLFKYIKKYYSPFQYKCFRSFYFLIKSFSLFNPAYVWKDRVQYLRFLLFQHTL